MTRLAALLLVAGVVAVAPWKMIDPDALMRLTAGRVIVEQGADFFGRPDVVLAFHSLGVRIARRVETTVG